FDCRYAGGRRRSLRDPPLDVRRETGVPSRRNQPRVVRQPLERWISVGNDVCPLQHITERHEVATHHRGASRLEEASDGRGSGERVERPFRTDLQPIQLRTDERQQLGLVSDVAHGGKIGTSSRPGLPAVATRWPGRGPARPYGGARSRRAAVARRDDRSGCPGGAWLVTPREL